MPKQTFDLTPSWLTILNILRALCAGDPDAKAKLGLIDELRRPIELLARSNAEIRASEERVAALPKVPEKAIDFQCPACGAEVRRDGDLAWNVDHQTWELAGQYDACHCTACAWRGDIGEAYKELEHA